MAYESDCGGCGGCGSEGWISVWHSGIRDATVPQWQGRSQLQFRFSLWPGNLHMLQVWREIDVFLRLLSWLLEPTLKGTKRSREQETIRMLL